MNMGLGVVVGGGSRARHPPPPPKSLTRKVSNAKMSNLSLEVVVVGGLEPDRPSPPPLNFFCWAFKLMCGHIVNSANLCMCLH